MAKATSYGESAVLSKEHFKAKELLNKASMAAAVFRQLNQEQVDRIVERVAHAGFNQRVRLAKMAHEETGLGSWQDKVLKNIFATQFVHDSIRHETTVGVVSRDDANGITEVAEPIGPLFVKIPLSSPTATALFMILIALKSRNPVLISPSSRTLRCCAEAARVCYEAALAAGAPEDCIQWLDESSREMDHAVMSQPGLALIVAMGRPELIRAAFNSGTPVIASMPGHTPVLIDASADIPFAVRNIVASKTFDHGMLFAGEQAVVVDEKTAPGVIREFEGAHGHFLAPPDIKKLEAILFEGEDGASIKPEGIGRSAEALAKAAGIDAPAGTRLLIARQDKIGGEHPLSGVKLAPVLAFYVRPNFEGAANLCIELNSLGNTWHLAGIYANNETAIRAFADCMNVGQVMVNTPSALGAVGGIFNRLKTSFLLSCGPGSKAITNDNISAQHLLNLKRICRRRINERWQAFPKERFLDERLTLDVVLEEYNRNH
jgi:acetaldehyde dehydrogenase/alcohol dehydrogenase